MKTIIPEYERAFFENVLGCACVLCAVGPELVHGRLYTHREEVSSALRNSLLSTRPSTSIIDEFLLLTLFIPNDDGQGAYSQIHFTLSYYNANISRMVNSDDFDRSDLLRVCCRVYNTHRDTLQNT